MKTHYDHHIYPEMRQGTNGYWYIWYDQHTRESLKTKDKVVARGVFAVKKNERREKAIDAMTPKMAKPLSSFMEEYLPYREADGRAAHTVDMDSLALRLLVEYLGDKVMSAIQSQDIDLFHAWLMTPKKIRTPAGKDKVKKGCSKASVNVYIRHLKIACKTALRWGYVRDNLYAGVKQYKVEDKAVTPLTREEITEILLPAIPDKYADFRDLVALYLYLGGRGYEICQARAEQLIEVNGRRMFVIPKTKTHKARVVPIPREALSIIDRLPDEGQLFPRWQRVQTVSHKLKRYLRACGLGHQWLHGLRHTNISHLTMAGVPTKAIMDLVGQTQESTLDRYRHLSPEYLIEVADGVSFFEQPPDSEGREK
jgi:integrase